jgi:uncharacterized protein YdhG (YjbR/CyaY superfamily)
MRAARTSAKKAPPSTVAEYLERVPEAMRPALEKLRRAIRNAAPEATELLSYQVPAYRLNRMLVSFGAAKGHCAFYVMSSTVMEAHAKELAGYARGKGSIQFAPEAPLPTALVARLVKARIAENEGLSRTGGRATRGDAGGPERRPRRA